MISIEIEKAAKCDPVSVNEAKRWLRLEIADDDDDIKSLISAATVLCETFTNRSFVNKGFIMTLDSFPYFVDTIMSQLSYPPSYYTAPRLSTTLWNYSQQVKLLRPPLYSVERITYLRFQDQQWHDLVQAPALWYPGKVTKLGDFVVDNNANVQKCIFAGTTNANPPTWNTLVGGTTIEVDDAEGEGSGPVQWFNQGPLDSTLRGTTGVQQGAPQFGNFIVDKHCEPARIFPGSPGALWPQVLYVPNSVQIHYTAGYGPDAVNVPHGIKTAVKLLVANWYENREASSPVRHSEIPNHIQSLLWSHRVLDFASMRG